jgi:hypothetical protein
MIQLTKAQFEKCWEIFMDLGEEGLYMNHYQLANATEIHAAWEWKAFLTDPKTVDYITTEMNIIRSAAINEMVHKAPNSNSVGQSQLINALGKLDEKTAKKEGPVFIYTYVPLNEEQKYAPNVRTLDAAGIEQDGEGGWIIDDET